MAGPDNINNSQWVVPTRFNELQNIQTVKKMELRKMFLSECSHLLPEELWDMILDVVFDKDSLVAYFEFKRKDKFYMDDHYLFQGNEKGWNLALAKIRANVNPFDIQDDIPTDTYCSGLCELYGLMEEVYFACPDEKGNKCDCHWTHHVFNSEDDFNAYYYAKKRHVSWIYNASGGRLWSLCALTTSHLHCPGIVMPVSFIGGHPLTPD